MSLEVTSQHVSSKEPWLGASANSVRSFSDICMHAGTGHGTCIVEGGNQATQEQERVPCRP